MFFLLEKREGEEEEEEGQFVGEQGLEGVLVISAYHRRDTKKCQYPCRWGEEDVELKMRIASYIKSQPGQHLRSRSLLYRVTPLLFRPGPPEHPPPWRPRQSPGYFILYIIYFIGHRVFPSWSLGVLGTCKWDAELAECLPRLISLPVRTSVVVYKA